jgi:hypothetical protein
MRWMIVISVLSQCITAPDPIQYDDIARESERGPTLPVEGNGYEQFEAHLNSIMMHCLRHFGTTDPLLVENTTLRLECAIRTMRIVQDSANPPLSREPQDFLTALIKDVEVVLSMWRNCAYNHRQLGEYISLFTQKNVYFHVFHLGIVNLINRLLE